MKILKIRILQPDKFKVGEFKEIGRFSVDYDDNVSIDFNLLLKSFDILYPSNKIVEFKIM